MSLFKFKIFFISCFQLKFVFVGHLILLIFSPNLILTKIEISVQIRKHINLTSFIYIRFIKAIYCHPIFSKRLKKISNYFDLQGIWVLCPIELLFARIIVKRYGHFLFIIKFLSRRLYPNNDINIKK